MSENMRLLVIGYVWPEPRSSAAGGRMMQLLELFQQMGMNITFASPAADSEYMSRLADLGIEKVNILLNDSSFDVFIRELMPDIVLFDRFMMEEQFGWRVAENCPDALRILDTEDLHCLRKARQKAFKESKTLSQGDLFSDTAKREIASIFRCDCSLIISEFEMRLLADTYKVDQRLLFYLPLLCKPIDETCRQHWPSFESRKDFVFIGNFLHEPNVNALQYLKFELWPLIHKSLPAAQLHVYGAYPSQQILEMNNPEEGFYIKGRAEDSKAVLMNARISLAPIRFGAGLKGKLIESMICGTPSITTAIGAEGIAGDFAWAGMIRNVGREFAESAVQLYADEELWMSKQQNGISIINARFSRALFEQPFMAHIQKLISNPAAARLQNFMGAMLMYHTTASGKYMAKWIESKNSKNTAE